MKRFIFPLTLIAIVNLNAFGASNSSSSAKEVKVLECISQLIPSIPDGNHSVHANPAVMANYSYLCDVVVNLEMTAESRFLNCLTSLVPAIPDGNQSAHANPAVMANYSMLCSKIVNMGN